MTIWESLKFCFSHQFLHNSVLDFIDSSCFPYHPHVLAVQRQGVIWTGTDIRKRFRANGNASRIVPHRT